MRMIRILTSLHKTTDEMNPEEFQEFRRGWYRHTVRSLMGTAGVTKEEAAQIAKKRFLAMKKDGFSLVNKTTLHNRKMRKALVKRLNEKRTEHVECCNDLSRVEPGEEEAGPSLRRWPRSKHRHQGGPGEDPTRSETQGSSLGKEDVEGVWVQ